MTRETLHKSLYRELRDINPLMANAVRSNTDFLLDSGHGTRSYITEISVALVASVSRLYTTSDVLTDSQHRTYRAAINAGENINTIGELIDYIDGHWFDCYNMLQYQ